MRRNTFFVNTLLLSILFIQTITAQTIGTSAVTPEMRKEANDYFVKQDWVNAQKVYENIVRLEPENARAMARLGAVYHSLGQYAKAAEVLQKALSVPNSQMFAPPVMYNVAAAYSRLNDKNKAYEWLDKSVQAGFSMTQTMSGDADFEKLRGEAKFKELLAKTERNAKPCTARAEYRQFDFWIGEWEVKTAQGQPAGTSSIQLILNDCVLLENWASQNMTGKSFNMYNTASGKWEQKWMDDKGSVTDYSGTMKDANTLQYLAETTTNGQKALLRMTFTKLSPDQVRQHGEASTDSGKTWATQYDLIYFRKK